MKYLSKIILGLLCTGIMASCKDDDEGEISGITVDKEEITIGAEGGIEKITVSSGNSWVASVSRPWIEISPANGIGSAECSLTIDSTLENTSRTVQVRFVVEGQDPRMVTVTQFGYGKQILLKEPEMEIESSAVYDKRYLEATISTNVNFAVEKVIDYSFADSESMSKEDKAEYEQDREGWLTLPSDDALEVNLDRGARPRSVKVRFRWDMNTTPYARVAKIHLVAQKPEEDQLVDDNGNPVDEVILTVTQKPALKIEDNRAGDSLAIITINEKLQSLINFDTSENMMNWSNVTLWESTDKDAPEGAVGRVRSVSFTLFDLKDGETLPKEIRYLKYLESFSILSNINHQIRIISLGEEICELRHLKELTVSAFGMDKLPENFNKLGGAVDKSYTGLERLNIGSNNFSKLSELTKVINPSNFPKLNAFILTGCRRTDSYNDLSQGDTYRGNPLGLHIDLGTIAESKYRSNPERTALLDLLAWDNLRELTLSYNFIEGELPDDDEVISHLRSKGKETHYVADDFFEEAELKANPSIFLDKISSDTCKWLKSTDNPVTYKMNDTGIFENVKGQDVPRVLPKARVFYINLNFLTGPLPKWILFHPYLVEWGSESMVFNQQENGRNSDGMEVGFDNIDKDKFDYSYYYGDKDYGDAGEGVAYPLYYRRYVANASESTAN